jgi:DNA-binding CsgD family transcriptional regulator
MQAGAGLRPLIGREHELARIDGFLERAASDSAALMLEGEPGIGKTTLWQAAIDAALARGRLVLRAQPAEAEQELSFSGLGDLLVPALARRDALAAPRQHALEVALLLAKDEYRTPDLLAVALATRDLLRLLAEDGPLMVAIDDLQWLDRPSWEALAYALRRLAGEPVAVLMAARPGAEPLPHAELERVGVGPVSLGALHELLRGQVGATMTRPTLLRIHETSGGNPFFALELARALDGRELRPGEPLPVPATLGDLAAARLGRLDRFARVVLLYVAALAHPTHEAVTAAAGADAGSALEAAEAAGVVEIDDARVRFTHPLLASMHYGSASAEERARVHRRLAEVVTDPEERGRHLGAAATGPDAEVADALDDAAAAAHGRGAPAAAAELADIAVRFTPRSDSAALVRRLCAGADHHFAAGSTRRAQSLLEHALALAPRGIQHARVAVQLAAVLDTLDPVTGRSLLTRARREAGADAALRAEIHQHFAYSLPGDVRASRRHARAAFRLAERTGDPRLVAETLALAFDRDFWCGAGIDEAAIARAIALEEQLPRLALDTRPSCAYAFALKWSGELERAAPLWQRLRELGRAQGDPAVVEILFFSAFHELIAENWEQAARYVEEARTLAVDSERDVEVHVCIGGRAVIAAYRGQREQARGAAAEATGFGEAAQFFPGWALGVLDLSLGDPAAALAQLRPATEEKRSSGVREPSLLLGFPEHVEAAVACGELDEASELLTFVEQHARRLDRAWALGCCARGRALLATARGDEAAAEAAFALAYHEHARRPQQLPTYELARTLLAHGSSLRRRQQKRRAHDALTRASTLFGKLGAVVYADRARSELARIGGRAVAAGDELSQSERQIAELVAQGLSNKEVAAALSLSPKTVEWNLSKVYAKLGVRSRTELAGRRR